MIIGRGGGGQVVSMLACYSDDPSLITSEAYIFYVYKCVVKNKN